MSTYNNSSETGRLAPQSMLQQRYLIVQPAGRGGMSAVYEAVDNRSQRRVAIKEMSQARLDEAGRENALALFQQEAQMLRVLSHANLPHIYDSFSENGRSFLVMDFIEGKTLHQILREAKGQPLPVAQVLFYARQLCDVLGYLHQQRPPIIFRDVKPTNVMVTAQGQVFLIDFGIARFFKEEQALDTVFLGSPGYAPPEQHGLSQTNPRADIYGLGATLHYCLTGHDPYYSKDRFVFASIRATNPQVPVELEQLIRRMVARDEQERPASMREVAQTLERISGQTTAHTEAIAPQHIPLTLSTPLAAPPVAPTTPVKASGANLQPTRPAQSLAPTAQISYDGSLSVAQQNGVGKNIWSAGFIALFAGLLVLAIAGSAFALSTFTSSSNNGWIFIVASVISLLQLIIVGRAISNAHTMLSRVALIVTALATFVAGFVALALGEGDVQTAVQAFLPVSTLNILLPVSFTVALIASLGWLARPFTIAYRAILLAFFVVAIACVWFAFSGIADILHYIAFLAAFILLLEGNVLAIQLER